MHTWTYRRCIYSSFNDLFVGMDVYMSLSRPENIVMTYNNYFFPGGTPAGPWGAAGRDGQASCEDSFGQDCAHSAYTRSAPGTWQVPAEDVQTLLRHIHVQSNRYKCTVIRCIENRCQAHFFPPSHIWQSPGRKDVYWTLLMMSFFCVSASEMQVSVRVVSSLQFATQVLCSQNVLPTSIIQLYHPHSEDHRKNKTLMEKKYH